MVQGKSLSALKLSLLLLSLSSLSGCSMFGWFLPEKQVVTETKYVKQNIPLQPPPRQVETQDIHFYVVTASNFEEFKARFEAENNTKLVVFALSVKDYEKLAMNIAELKRYIEQQKSAIVYYEKAISEPVTQPPAIAK